MLCCITYRMADLVQLVVSLNTSYTAWPVYSRRSCDRSETSCDTPNHPVVAGLPVPTDDLVPVAGGPS